MSKFTGDMATQLMGEFRPTCLALQAFRLAPRQVASETATLPSVVAPDVVGDAMTRPMSERKPTSESEPAAPFGAGGGPPQWLSDCAPFSPFRLPAWRWRLAMHWVGHRKPPPRTWVDPWVRQARDYLRCSDRTRRRRAKSHDPLAVAVGIHCDPDPRRRWALEAWIVSGADRTEIANQVDHDCAAVEAYEHLFFDVSGRLEALDWLGAFVFGRRLYDGLTEADGDVIAKLIGFQLGPAVLGAYFRWLGWPGAARSAPSRQEEVKLARAFELLVAALTFRVDDARALQVIRLAIHLNEIEQREAECNHSTFAQAIVPTNTFLLGRITSRAAVPNRVSPTPILAPAFVQPEPPEGAAPDRLVGLSA